MPQAPAARELARLVREQSIHLQLIDATTMLIDCTSHADVPHYSILTTDQTEQLKRDLRLTDMKQLWHLSPQDPQVIYWDYPCGSVLSFIETLDSSLEGTRCFRLVVDTHPPG
jgi:DNA-directed RNA polymerase subunit H (RpoH/RPB5)